MKKGKIILSVAAALVTVSSALAFKISSKFTSGRLVFAMTVNSIVNGTCPVTCRSLRTSTTGTHFSTCITKGGVNRGIGRSLGTFFIAIGADNRTCIGPVIRLHKSL